MLFWKNGSSPVVLPVLALGSMLFYLFWSAPLSLLLQIYLIDSWHIWDNPYLSIAIHVVGGVFLLLALFYFVSLKISLVRWAYLALIGLLIFGLTATLLYPMVFPYNYGAFTDDNHLIPTLSLLGFSKARYALDALLLGGALIFTVFCIRKDFSRHFFLLIFIYYTAEGVFTASKAAGRFSNRSDVHAPVLVSENHPNIFYFIYDGFGPSEVNYFLTNGRMPEELTNWVEGFTFYSNVTALSTLYTAASLPSMYEGYTKTPQILLDTLIREKHGYDYVYIEPLGNLHSALSPHALITEKKAPSLGNSAPLLLPRIYAIVPYFLRHTLAREFAWKYYNLTRWIIRGTPFFKLKSAATQKPTLVYQYDDYTHHPWSSQKIQVSNLQEQGDSPQKLEELLFENSKDVFTFIASIIRRLKELGVYENSKIIITSDHDTHTDRGEISYNLLMRWGRSIRERGAVGDLHSLLMIKELGESKWPMQYDGRFLTVADIPGNIERTLGLSQNPDFIGEDYVPRVVHVPRISYGNFHNLLKDAEERKKLPPEITFDRLSSVASYHNIDSFSVPLENIAAIPAYEIIP